MSERPDFPEQLRRLRAEAGLTQEKLAEKAGLSVAAIGNLERGEVGKPHAATLRRLARALDVPLYELDAVARRPRTSGPRDWQERRPLRVAGPLDGPATILGDLVREQWRTEAEIRRLGDPLPVRWAPAPAGLSDTRLETGAAGPPGGLARVFREMPCQRLVVLGPPGAGKTGLLVLLLLGLLEDWRPWDPVPVVLSPSSWNAGREPFAAWLRRRLVEDYPRLRELGSGVVDDLVAGDRVLPLLDGLDELPEAVRERAVERIRMAGPAVPLVVASRTAEYRRAVDAKGPLRNAAVVELQPVEPAAAIDYLRAGPRAGRWEKVFAELREHPEGLVAGALSTPLMVSLAGTVYERPSTTPEELLGLASRRAVEDHVLDGLIPAAFEAHRLRRETADDPWDAEHARRWLVFLAVALRWRGTRDLAWWELWQSKRYGLVIGAIFAAAFVAVAGRLPGNTGNLGLVVEWAFCLGIAAAVPGKRPMHSVLKVDAEFSGRLRIAAKESLRLGANFGVVVLAVVGTLAGLIGGVARGPWAGLSAALRYGGVIGTAMGLSVAVGTVALGILKGLLRESGEPPSPASSLRTDRAGLLAFATMAVPVLAAFVLPIALVAGLASALGTGVQLWPMFADLRAFIPNVLLGILCVLFIVSQWLVFQLTRLALALGGRLPFRLMTFLDDAHQAGVLRQVGAVYQFRHAELQDHLAGGGLIAVWRWWMPLRCAGCRKTIAPWATRCPRCGEETSGTCRAHRPGRIPAAGLWLLVRAYWACWWLVDHPALDRALGGWLAPATLVIAFLAGYTAAGMAIIRFAPGGVVSGPIWGLAFAAGLAAAGLVGLVLARRAR